MLLGCLLVGMASGAIAALSILISGLGIWLALLAYSATGAGALCLAAAFACLLRRAEPRARATGIA